MDNRFIQIHFLTSYPSVLLNRDDAGFAKRIPFGGVTRTRISSQCLKRHWRTSDGEHSLSGLGVPASVRSRMTFEREVVQPLIKEGQSEPMVRAVTAAFMAEVLGESAKARKAKEAKEDGGESPEELKTGQVTILGRPEVDFLRQEVRAVCAEVGNVKDVAKAVKARLDRERKKNLQALRHAAGLDAALFGRMVTSDILARTDAAVHVAHAFTVHAEAAESDYFSAVDDLLQGEDGEMGSGHINSSELTSGLYYGYLVVDVPLLVSNLEGCRPVDVDGADRELAARVVERLVHLVAKVSPGAKLGSTAPYAHAHLVLVETGKAQPRTLANAFLKPVAQHPDPLGTTYQALAGHLADLDRMYGSLFSRRLAALAATPPLLGAAGCEAVLPLADVARWASDQVRGG